jgi:hypothetical protein
MSSVLLGWAVVGAAVLLLIGLAGSVLSMNPPAFVVAKTCLSAAVLVLMCRTGWWLAFELETETWERLFGCAFLFGFAGLLWMSCMVWIQGRENSFLLPLVFKDSPLLTNKIKHRAIRDVSGFRAYLLGLELPIPNDTPPIRVQTGIGSSGTGMYEGDQNTAQYRKELSIGEAQVNDRTVYTDLYAGYVVSRLLTTPKQLRTARSIADIAWQTVTANTFATYLSHSYWDNCDPKIFGFPWLPRLCAMRAKFGQKLTDRLVIYTLRSMSDDPAEGRDQDFDVYVARKIKIADGIVESESRSWPEIENFLRDNGVAVDKLGDK